MGFGEVRAAVSTLRDVVDDLVGTSFDTLTAAELTEVLDELQTVSCQLPAVSHRLLARLQTETTAREMGARSWRDVWAIRWRISHTEASRRLKEAELLGPRRTLTGEPMEPVLPATADAQARGLSTAEHVKVIRDALGDLPHWVDALTREQFEADLAVRACGIGPKELKSEATRQLFLMDQDGPEPDDTERARKRGVWNRPQGRDLMTDLKSCFTPSAWAAWEAIFATLAAPGMCHPADETPCVSGTPSQAQIDADQRTVPQRRHDAMEYVAKLFLASRLAGSHNGLPTSIIVRTTLDDILSLSGIGVTGGGTVMPVADILQSAAQSHWFLAIFDTATGSALNLYRSRRTTSVAQRLMLIARDGGCTKPGCPTGFYGCQAHHADTEWAHGGNTNVDEMALACPPDNRDVHPDGWTTALNDQHEAEWTPPPNLDTGQSRVNGYHRHEYFHPPPENPAEPVVNEPVVDEPVLESPAEPVADESAPEAAEPGPVEVVSDPPPHTPEPPAPPVEPEPEPESAVIDDLQPEDGLDWPDDEPPEDEAWLADVLQRFTSAYDDDAQWPTTDPMPELTWDHDHDNDDKPHHTDPNDHHPGGPEPNAA